MEKCYSTDLSDAEWECLKLHVPAPNKRGGLRDHSRGELLNAIFHVLKSGCPWRLQPKNLPPWETVYSWFGRWREDGTFERLRSRLGRNPLPSTGIADSQSSKTTGVRGEQRGYDGNKKVRGRKRHLLVDTEGLVLKAKVLSAKVPDQDGLRLLLESARMRLSLQIVSEGEFSELHLRDSAYSYASGRGFRLFSARVPKTTGPG
jgi:putative transposase